MSKNEVIIPVQKLEGCPDLPKYAYLGDAGFDLRSAEVAKLAPLERKVIKCGFSMAIPEGCAGLVLPRSGLAAKHGITVVNAPGLIDSGYRGEICVVLLNTDTTETFDINIGDRIAQMIIIPYFSTDFEEINELPPSQRDNKGFGSSGI